MYRICKRIATQIITLKIIVCVAYTKSYIINSLLSVVVGVVGIQYVGIAKAISTICR